MINLIPPTARKGVVTEYWVRVVTVWMIVLATTFIMVAIMQSPAYVLVKLQLNGFSEGVAEAAVKKESFEAGQIAIKNAHVLSALLLDTTETTSFATVFDELEKLSGDDVSIEGFFISREEGQIDALEVTGVAATRAALNDYRNRVEAHELFSEVYLPINNLAKQSDILFQIRIEMSPNVSS